MKVLVIDDNVDITEMISQYLKMSGHECNYANDGRNGLNMILNKRFDVVLLDLAMPEFSGRDVINELVEKNKIKDQPVILFTASSKPNKEINELIQKGVHSCLKKPIDPDELVSYLKTVIGQKNEN